MNNAPSYPGTQSVRRAVTLLKAFTDQQPQWGLSELAQRAGLNKTTTYRLLAALESEGLLMRSTDGDAYRLGPEAIVLGGRALRNNDLRTIARAELEVLAQASGETVTLEMLTGAKTLILDEVPGAHVLGAAQSLGTRWAAHATSTGRVLLAALPEAEVSKRLALPLQRFTENTLVELPALLAELARVRQQGYALVVEELEPGYVAVGAPLRNHDRQAVAAISLGGPGTRLHGQHVQQLAALLLAAAARISEQLGYRK